MAIAVDPYLFFPGNAEEAVSFYRDVFGGEATVTHRGDVDPTANETERQQVINALITGGDVTLRASDRTDTNLELQTRVELSIIGVDQQRLGDIFETLAKGGTVRSPLEKQFWGDVYGAVTDKFGIGWQVNVGSAGA
jgi:PhnB protein